MNESGNEVGNCGSRAPACETRPGTGAASAPPTRALPRRRILVADDNRDAADSLALLLGLEGHEVQVAYDGGQALARFHSFKPQVVLLDISMPTYSGNELAALIRSQPAGNSVTLVALSGFGQPQDQKLAQQSGFDHHLTKPVGLQELIELIGAAAGSAC